MSDRSPFVSADDIPWRQWSTPAPTPTDEGFREIALVALDECHSRDVTIAALLKQVDELHAEIRRYTRTVVSTRRLYKRRPSLAADDEPQAASRKLGLDV